uniref:Secreted protein n=1 Tax=Setaria viridis TaxID=4556 RepID=A0A4U6V9L9_SETVI|nr:hypothetical protein SEVIR_3G101750v2 [Setaria viridis]
MEVSTGCVCFLASFSSLLFMMRLALVVSCCRDSAAVLPRRCFVDALPIGGVRKSNAGWCFHRFHHSLSRTPLGRRWMVVRGARTRCR